MTSPATQASGASVSDTTPEDLLLEAAHSALQMPRARVAVLLRLSALARQNGPRGYHRRIAHAVLDETAHRYEGQVFLLRNGDAVLLCRNAGEPVLAGDPLAQPHLLPKLFTRLFELDAAAGTALTTIWRLEEDAEALLSYAEASRTAASATAAPAAATASPQRACCVPDLAPAGPGAAT